MLILQIKSNFILLKWTYIILAKIAVFCMDVVKNLSLDCMTLF